MTEDRPEQTGPEQGGQNPGTPGSEAEDVPGRGSPGREAEEVPGSGSSEDAPAGDSQPSQEELRARLEEQLRNLRVEDLMVESVVSVLNLTARRIAKEDERDLEQGRVGIEAIRAWVDLLPEEAATQIRSALSELQLLYANAVEGGGPGAPPAGDPGPPGSGAEDVSRGGSENVPGGRPSSAQPPRPGEPPPRLWTPGSS
jgi:hypothetical protein